MKAIIYKDELGKELRRRRHPGRASPTRPHAAREHLLEEVSHYDDELVELILEEAEIPVDRLKAAIRKATLEIKLTPVLCGSSFKNKGVQPLLDAVLDYLPEPARRPAGRGHRSPSRATTTAPGRPQGRRLRAVRRAGVQDHGRPVRRQAHLLPRLLGQARGRLARPQRQHRQDRAHRPHPDDARQRPRGGRRGLRGRHRRGGRHQAGRHRRHAAPRPTSRSSSRRSTSPSRSSRSPIEPKTKADQEKMSVALGRLAEEDPTFQVATNEETGQTEISGMGELHLEVLVDRMLREFKVEANVGRPQVSYRETVRGTRAEDRGPVRPPDRRLGPVRHRLHRHRAGARRGLRLRQQDQGRLDPDRVHPGRREGRRGGAGDRRQGRLPDGRRPRDAHRRQVPRHGLVGDRLQDRRLARVPGGGQARQAGAARADLRGRGRRRPRSSSATSSATSTAGAAASRAGAARQRAGRARPRSR